MRPPWRRPPASLNGHHPADPPAPAVPPRPPRRRIASAADTLRRRVAALRARSRRFPRYERAVAGLAAAWALMFAGAWLTFGLGWALLTGGAELAVYFLVPYDVDRPLPPAAVRSDLPPPLRRFAALPEDEEAL